MTWTSGSRSLKRKRKHRRVDLGDGASSSVKEEEKNDDERFRGCKSPRSDNIFNGLIFAVSTCNKTSTSDVGVVDVTTDKNSIKEDSPCASYKDIMKLCKSGGASVSGQVHKRVHALICTRSSFYAAPLSSANTADHPVPTIATQRVRKALKYSLDILDVSWVKDSLQQGTRLPYKNDNGSSSYLLTDLAKEAAKNMPSDTRADKTVEHTKKIEEADSNFDDANAVTGWSEPVELDCCCVCHENGDDQCPWCVECNVNQAKKDSN